MTKKAKSSPQTVDQAMKIAKGTQAPGQTKEQTKIIARGIQKGIEQYKKQEKAKARERDKAKKKESRQHSDEDVVEVLEPAKNAFGWLPWTLLVLSWLGFGGYFYLTQFAG